MGKGRYWSRPVAYVAQGHGAEIIDHIDGSYTNVVGLPMEATAAVLREFAIEPKR